MAKIKDFKFFWSEDKVSWAVFNVSLHDPEGEHGYTCIATCMNKAVAQKITELLNSETDG